MIEVRVVGPVEACHRGASLPVGSRKQRLVLSMLSARYDAPVGLDELVSELWPERPPASAVANVRTYVGNLRRLFAQASGHPDVIVRAGSGYRIVGGMASCDAPDFLEKIRIGRTALDSDDAAGAADRFERALLLWRGVPFDGLDIGPWLAGRRVVLEDGRAAALEGLAEARLRLGEAARAQLAARELVSTYPLREGGHRLLMIALYHGGDTAGAMRAYASARSLFVDQLGVEPGAGLATVHRAILRDDREALAVRPGRAVAAPAVPEGRPGPVAAAPPRQLPPRPPVVLGRSADLEAVVGALAGGPAQSAHAGVVAVHGSGGVGKSTLALVAAHDLADRYPDGQLYVDLQGATPGLRPLEPVDALGQFLRALGVPRASVPASPGEATNLFRSSAASRRLLVVADNAASTAQVAPLIPSNSECAVIVTSRRVLGDVPGARHVPVSPLPLTESIKVLSALSGRVVARSDTAAVAVAMACGGLPLALAVAAARLVSRPDWTFDDLAERLGGEERTLEELEVRGRGVRSSLTISYRELETSNDPSDRSAARAFRALGVLRVPAAGQDLIAAVLRAEPAHARTVLDRLIDARLVNAVGGRFGLHDLVRLYAVDLAYRHESAEMRTDVMRAALSWYAVSGWRATGLLRPSSRRMAPLTGVLDLPSTLTDRAAAISWLDAEHSNSVEVVRHAVQPETGLAPLAAQVVLGLYPSLLMRSYVREWELLCQLVLDAAEHVGDQQVIAQILSGLAFSYRGDGRFAEATRCLEEALTIHRATGDGSGEARALDGLGLVQASSGQAAAAVATMERGIEIRTPLGEEPELAAQLSNLAYALTQLGRFGDAVARLEHTLAIRRRYGDVAGEALALANIAEVRLRQGLYPDVVETARLVAERSHEGGDVQVERRAWVLEARGQLGQGHIDGAEQAIDRALALSAVGQRVIDSDFEELIDELEADGHQALATRIRAHMAGP